MKWTVDVWSHQEDSNKALHKIRHICQIMGGKNTFRQNKMRENEGVAVCAVLNGATLAATVKVYAMRCVTVQLSDPLHV